jgi:hypothetical protein
MRGGKFRVLLGARIRQPWLPAPARRVAEAAPAARHWGRREAVVAIELAREPDDSDFFDSPVTGFSAQGTALKNVSTSCDFQKEKSIFPKEGALRHLPSSSHVRHGMTTRLEAAIVPG